MHAQLVMLGEPPEIRVPPPDAPGAAAPVFKWAGGKRWLVPLCGRAIRAYLGKSGGRYIEPFLGGGAMALWIGAAGALLGDIEAPLVEAYRAMADAPEDVAAELEALVQRGTSRRRFEDVRRRVPNDPVARAARLLYLNRLAFNGLYRVNRAGHFNVPYGRHDGRPHFPSARDVALASAALRRARLHAGDFEALVSAAGPRDVIFADPPYFGGFGEYAQRPFSEEDHARLAAALERAARRGAGVVATNSADDRVRAWYAWAEIVPTSERRAVGCTTASRARASCLLMTTHPQLVWPATSKESPP
jgi:DNA adenine methylase